MNVTNETSIFFFLKERSQISNIALQLKKLERGEKKKPKTSRRREITKARVKINEIEGRKNKRGNQLSQSLDL